MAQWVVVGASRGIGLELCRQVRARGDVVVASVRRSSAELATLDCVVVEGVDVAHDDAGKVLARALPGGPVDVLVCNAGILLRGGFDAAGVEAARSQLEVNTLGPLRIVSALSSRLGAGAKIALVSSKAGSIGDGPSGGMYGYRISKAALNMAGANLAYDLRAQGVHVAVLHPGFVRTEMTGGAGNLGADEAAAGLIARIDELDAARSGRFFHADGAEIPW